MFQYLDLGGSMPSTSMEKRHANRAGILLHSTAGTSSRTWLQRVETDPAKKSSADFLIARNGNIEQLVPVGYFSYHAGAARWRGINWLPNNLNEVLIGIEHECLDQNGQDWTNEQYIASCALVRKLLSYHGLSVLSIALHKDVALPPGRKSDPATLHEWVWTREFLTPSVEAGKIAFPAILP